MGWLCCSLAAAGCCCITGCLALAACGLVTEEGTLTLVELLRRPGSTSCGTSSRFKAQQQQSDGSQHKLVPGPQLAAAAAFTNLNSVV